MNKILRFFNAYDASRDLNILMLKKRLDQMKKENQRMRTNQAFDYAEKSDIENLFLDCIEQCKKDQWRDDNARVGLRTAAAG